jgi:hypothetical protein
VLEENCRLVFYYKKLHMRIQFTTYLPHVHLSDFTEQLMKQTVTNQAEVDLLVWLLFGLTFCSLYFSIHKIRLGSTYLTNQTKPLSPHLQDNESSSTRKADSESSNSNPEAT